MKPLYTPEKKPHEVGEIRDATTVILLNEKGKAPFEIFLMRRHRKQSFMGSAYVFPGGRLDDGDCEAELAEYTPGFDMADAPAKLQEPDTPPVKALGLLFAGIRETFEEAGVLLAAHAEDDEESIARFLTYRKKLHNGEISLLDLIKTENVRFRLDLLTAYSRWITPEVESKRFDTRFLLARTPDNQEAVHDSIEMTESLWITPQDALKKQKAGDLMLMPPTLKTVEELSAYSSVDELFSAAKGFEIKTILPQAHEDENSRGILLPHDPEYQIEEYKQEHRPGEPSRVLRIDGCWQTVIV